MKKYIALLLVTVLAISLIGCSKKDTTPQEDTDIVNEDNQDIENEENETVDPSPETKKAEVTLYFANKDYVETGDESYEKLIPEIRTIEYENIPLEEAIIKELIKGPDSNELTTSIPSSITLLGAETKDGTCYVNFSQEGLYGGSMEEDFTISQIVNSLLKLDNVDRVQFLIDGEKAESLMGHFTITDPFEEPLYNE